MKFRIVSQRGVFRIQRLESNAWRSSTVITTKSRGNWITGVVTSSSSKVVWAEALDWNFCGEQAGVEFAVQFIPARDARADGDLPWACCEEDLFHKYEFDTYKKAENYIKKFYGSTGVDAIEKPEWKTV